MNKYEKACKEWLKDCSCVNADKQEECEECTNAFLNHVKKLNREDCIELIATSFCKFMRKEGYAIMEEDSKRGKLNL